MQIDWVAVETLMLALGCNVVEGAGSRVRFEYRGLVASFHRPHPGKEAKRHHIRDARKFLMELGIVP